MRLWAGRLTGSLSQLMSVVMQHSANHHRVTHGYPNHHSSTGFFFVSFRVATLTFRGVFFGPAPLSLRSSWDGRMARVGAEEIRCESPSV